LLKTQTERFDCRNGHDVLGMEKPRRPASKHRSLLVWRFALCSPVDLRGRAAEYSYEDRDERICTFIGVKSEAGGQDPARWKPCRKLLLVWTVPILLFNISIILLLIGLGILIFDRAVQRGPYHVQVC
jgi:hypothetical protein